MITIKTEEEIQRLREGGKRLAEIIARICERAAPGVSTKELDQYAGELLTEGDDTSAFFHYQPSGAPRPYPASICISINEDIVHGIPNESDRVLADGDVVSFDVGLVHDGLITDSAYTIGVGTIDAQAQKLLQVTEGALYAGIDAAKARGRVGDIGNAIERFVEPSGFAIFEELVGHGVGYKLHESPYIPNIGDPGKGPLLKPGMVIAIEPMIGEGSDEIVVEADGYTIRTADGSRAAHFEHTIVITENGPEILTKL